LICEIGARFPLNGYLASAYLDEAITDERSIFELHKDRILDALGVNQGIEESPQSFEVLILTGKEVGFDIHYLASEITGVEMMSYTSEAWREPNQADLIILELRKEEVESVLDVIVDLMLKGQRFVNDPRTVIVGHDKMLLKFLKDRAYLSTIIGKEKATFLTNHIIETYSVVHDKIDLRNKSHWVAKLKHGGKRIGMLVGAVESDERWSKVNEEFVIQPYIEQTDVQIYNHISRRLDTANRVGMMLTIDGKFIGLGMYRFFSKDLRFLTMGGHIVVEDYQ
jgi:chorismate mutase